MPTRANALAVMAMAPLPGSVKTRMVPPLTHEQAAELCRALLLDQLEHLSALKNVDLYLAFSPPEAAPLIKSLAPNVYKLFPQQGDDLGERMSGVFGELWRVGHHSVALIGSDVAAPPLNFFYDMFKQLSSPHRRVVLGPGYDGRYYLVGMNQPTLEIFHGMTWSHNQVLAQTTARLARSGVDYTLLPRWFDLDTVADIDLLRSAHPTAHVEMQRTIGFLQRLNLWSR